MHIVMCFVQQLVTLRTLSDAALMSRARVISANQNIYCCSSQVRAHSRSVWCQTVCISHPHICLGRNMYMGIMCVLCAVRVTCLRGYVWRRERAVANWC